MESRNKRGRATERSKDAQQSQKEQRSKQAGKASAAERRSVSVARKGAQEEPRANSGRRTHTARKSQALPRKPSQESELVNPTVQATLILKHCTMREFRPAACALLSQLGVCACAVPGGHNDMGGACTFWLSFPVLLLYTRC